MTGRNWRLFFKREKTGTSVMTVSASCSSSGARSDTRWDSDAAWTCTGGAEEERGEELASAGVAGGKGDVIAVTVAVVAVPGKGEGEGAEDDDEEEEYDDDD